MQRRIPFAPGEYYHIYSRGVEKRDIFLNDSDRKRFLKLLYLANGEKPFVFREIQDIPNSDIERGAPLVAIGAYVLMPNHFHLLVKEICEGGISAYMRKLLTGYSSYFNKRHGRTGVLFQNRFQSQHVNRDEQLKYLYTYIHLNPLKLISPNWKQEGSFNLSNSKDFITNYEWSSCSNYIGPSYGGGDILSKKDFPDYFSESDDVSSLLEDWILLKKSFT